MSEKTTNSVTKLDRSGINRVFTILGTVILYGVILFASAGRINWLQAWILLGIYFAGILVNGLYSLRHNPGLINERGRMSKNTKSWDKVIGLVYMFLLLAIYLLGGLDARYHWSAVPVWLEVLGGVGFVFSLAVTFFAMKANAFLSTFVRIQDDRGHTTVTGGPYRFVRHPMYAGVLIMSLAMPLLLGSWWALIAGGLCIVLFIIRTSLEDRTLQAELPGYMDYVKQVRFRLIPFVW